MIHSYHRVGITMVAVQASTRYLVPGSYGSARGWKTPGTCKLLAATLQRSPARSVLAACPLGLSISAGYVTTTSVADTEICQRAALPVTIHSKNGQ